MEDSHLFLVCPNCSIKKDLIEKHFLTALRYKLTAFVVLCKCGTSWDIQTGKLSPISDTVLEQIRKYSEEKKSIKIKEGEKDGRKD